MFSNECYAKIKKVEKQEKVTICQISTSTKKNDKYECDFIGYCRFVGNAHNNEPVVGQRIKIISCGVSNCYSKDNNLNFLKNPNYIVFDYILLDDSDKGTKKSELLADLENIDGLPF